TCFKPILYLDADTYHVEPLFCVRPSIWCDPVYLLSPAKTLAYCNRILPSNKPLRNGEKPNQEGIVCWNGNITLPTLIDMHIDKDTGTRFPDCVPENERVRCGAVWMSLTPNEMLTQRSGIQRASGKVLIGGLGLGWFLGKVCAK